MGLNSELKISPDLQVAHMNQFVGSGFATVVDQIQLKVVANVSLKGKVPDDVLSGLKSPQHFVRKRGVF
jgi:hypothetical protein